MTLTDEQIEEIKARADIPALLSALEAEKKRADEAEQKRKCFECGSELMACASCNPDLVSTELDRPREENERYREAAKGQAVIVNTASSRIKELEAEVVKLREALAALDRMSRGVDWCDQDEQARRWSAARRVLEGGKADG